VGRGTKVKIDGCARGPRSTKVVPTVYSSAEEGRDRGREERKGAETALRSVGKEQSNWRRNRPGVKFPETLCCGQGQLNQHVAHVSE